jgi:hypothetical protein
MEQLPRAMQGAIAEAQQMLDETSDTLKSSIDQPPADNTKQHEPK